MDDSSAVHSAVGDEQFWAKVQRTATCWFWIGYKDRQGYGHLMRDGRNVLAHRHAYRLTRGEPVGVVRHSCDNPPCCNPEHLLDGTQADNIRDRQVRGRHRPGRLSGEDHPAHKLTRVRVIELRALWRWGVTVQALADDYGVSYKTVYAVVHGLTWKDEVA